MFGIDIEKLKKGIIGISSVLPQASNPLQAASNITSAATKAGYVSIKSVLDNASTNWNKGVTQGSIGINRINRLGETPQAVTSLKETLSKNTIKANVQKSNAGKQVFGQTQPITGKTVPSNDIATNATKLLFPENQKDLIEREVRKGGTPEEISNRIASSSLKNSLGFAIGNTKIDKGTNAVKEAADEIAKNLTPSQKLVQALKEAKPLTKEQKSLITKQKGERLAEAAKNTKGLSGTDWIIEQKKALKGEYDKVQFESIKNQLTDIESEGLVKEITDNKYLTPFEKLRANSGLEKMLNGKVPQESELKILNDVFGEDFTTTLKDKQPLLQKAKEAGYQTINLPRTLMSSFDLSAPLRQGFFMVSKPKTFAKDFGQMFKYFTSEKGYQEGMQEIMSRPSYVAMKENKLALTDIGPSLNSREEAFMSNWGEKIPVVGKGVKASGRAYTGFLNKIRADVFDDFVKKGEQLGIDNPEYLKDAANFINNATGRGDFRWLGKAGESIEKASPLLNGVFFSPRLIESRLTMINPLYYVRMDPNVRKEALKQWFTLTSFVGGVLSLAKMGGADVEIDPRSSDFAKLKFGNTRYDILAGFQQPIRAAAQIITGQKKSTVTGKINDMNGGYNQPTRWDVLTQFLEAKEAPLFSFAVGMMKGVNSIGEKFDPPTEIAKRFIPMIISDVQDLYNEYGQEGIPMAIPGIFGLGTQTYGGVETFGLKGKDYPALQKELDRLNTSMGYPTLTAYNQELTIDEYKKLKEKTGTTLAKVLTKLMEGDTYKQLPDNVKVEMIDRATDKVKEAVKEDMFLDKKIKSRIKSKLESKGLKGQELTDKTEEVYNKIDLSKLPQGSLK